MCFWLVPGLDLLSRKMGDSLPVSHRRKAPTLLLALFPGRDERTSENLYFTKAGVTTLLNSRQDVGQLLIRSRMTLPSNPCLVLDLKTWLE